MTNVIQDFAGVRVRIDQTFLAAGCLACAALLPSLATGEPLRQPDVCSAINAGTSALKFEFCEVAPTAGKQGQHDLTLSLTATTSPISVGGYRLQTDNYNGGYMPPTVEIKPGDTLKVRLLNALAATASGGASAAHAASGHTMQGTNLHTHGLIVSPKNAKPELPQNGDNIFIQLDRGQSLDYSIEIPTDLPSSLLDGLYGKMPHPSGLYWYHSHMHGISAAQVTGGMSGLLSIGARDANLVATKPAESGGLRDRTDISYLMLRDIQITSDVDPKATDGNSSADMPATPPDSGLCAADANGKFVPRIEARDGYCQNAANSKQIWLFTANGQRFPTIKIANGRNALLRMANISANVTYVLSLRDATGKAVAFHVLSVDGVVPGTPRLATQPPANNPDASKVETLQLMPAGRAEILLTNDAGDTAERRLVLQTDGLDTSAPKESAGDHWPQIKLAEVLLEGAPTAAPSVARLGLNTAIAAAEPQGRLFIQRLEIEACQKAAYVTSTRHSASIGASNLLAEATFGRLRPNSSSHGMPRKRSAGSMNLSPFRTSRSISSASRSI